MNNGEQNGPCHEAISMKAIFMKEKSHKIE